MTVAFVALTTYFLGPLSGIATALMVVVINKGINDAAQAYDRDIHAVVGAALLHAMREEQETAFDTSERSSTILSATER